MYRKVVCIGAPRQKKEKREKKKVALPPWAEREAERAAIASRYQSEGYKGQVSFWWSGPPLLQCLFCAEWYTRVASDFPPPGFCSVHCHDVAQTQAVRA
jgi:hypothetical protein